MANTDVTVTGIKKWALEYKRKIPDIEKIKREIDEFMTEFDRKENETKTQEKLKRKEPDNEGWITVTRTGKKKGIPRKAVVEEKILEKEKAKSKKLESTNFYKFQIRESKMRRKRSFLYLEELRNKFEEDKKKIALIRSSRKFKPY